MADFLNEVAEVFNSALNQDKDMNGLTPALIVKYVELVCYPNDYLNDNDNPNDHVNFYDAIDAIDLSEYSVSHHELVDEVKRCFEAENEPVTKDQSNFMFGLVLSIIQSHNPIASLKEHFGIL
jgi:hypothetical protein